MINKEPIIKKREIEPSDLKFSFNIKGVEYRMDNMQDKLLQFYLRSDPKFRMAFYTNYTADFFKFIRDKNILGEPYHLSVMGNVRSGKSYSMLSICGYHMAYYGMKMKIQYVCANAYEFVEKVKTMSESELFGSVFLVDEEKQGVFGVGSIARKMKISDVNHIIAINNISSIMLNPSSWANKESNYGLRVFGKNKETMTARLMLYNLQEGGRGGSLPLGCIYIPSFTVFLPYGKELEKQYLEKKNKWVMAEQRGEGDVLAEIKKNTAKELMQDKTFLNIKRKGEKLAYISQKLGSEFTKGEIDEIFYITKLMDGGNLPPEKD